MTSRECLTYKRTATVTDLAHLRSLLFAPGSDERKLERALASDADAVVCDLEDGVAPEAKDDARDRVARLLSVSDTCQTPRRMVRVNAADTQWFADDLAAVRGLEPTAILLPKATPEAVGALGHDGPPVIAIAETAEGVRLAHETASCARVAALALGAADLGAQLGLEPRADGLEILYARSKLVIDSAAAGVRPPLDVVHLDIHDEQGLEAEALLARSLGLRGKLCIHPAQVPVVNRVFAPGAGEIAWAERVIEAYEQGRREGRGAVALEGSLVDLPVVERARRVLEESKGASKG